MSTDDIITLFGGRAAISTITGAKPNAITQWKQAGIPSKFWHVLVAEAETRDLAGVTFDALAATRQAGAPIQPQPPHAEQVTHSGVAA